MCCFAIVGYSSNVQRFCQIIVRKGEISFVSSLSQYFSSSDPATFEEFKFNSKLATSLHVICYDYIWHFKEFRQESVKLYIKLYLLTMLLTGDELIRKVDTNLIITWFVFKLDTIQYLLLLTAFNMLKIISEIVLLLPTIDGQVEDYVKVGIILLTISGQVEHYVRCL